MQYVACQMQRGVDLSGEYVSNTSDTKTTYKLYNYSTVSFRCTFVCCVQCASSVGVPYTEVAECETDGLGTQLQVEAETDTRNVAHPRRQLAFVPTIVYNYVRLIVINVIMCYIQTFIDFCMFFLQEFNQQKQQRSLYDFQGVLCDEIELAGVPAPAICAQRG